MQGTVGVSGFVVVSHFNFEKAGPAAALAHFIFGGFTHGFHCQIQAKRNA
jgi:amino acid permease